MLRGWLPCPSFFFSSLFNTKLPLSPLGLQHTPFIPDSRPSEVRQESSAPLSTTTVRTHYQLNNFFLRILQEVHLLGNALAYFINCFGSSPPYNYNQSQINHKNEVKYANMRVLYCIYFMHIIRHRKGFLHIMSIIFCLHPTLLSSLHYFHILFLRFGQFFKLQKVANEFGFRVSIQHTIQALRFWIEWLIRGFKHIQIYKSTNVLFRYLKQFNKKHMREKYGLYSKNIAKVQNVTRIQAIEMRKACPWKQKNKKVWPC